MNTVFFGLDFGTTNSALSVGENGKSRLIDIDEFNLNGKTMRSILFFDENKNVFVGQSAINEYIKNRANGRLMQSIKTSLPHKNFTGTNIFGDDYRAEDLVSIILKHIKQTGEKYIGREINDVIIGRPAVFSDKKEEDALAETRLEAAAKYVGFKNIRFQFEPIAAALFFETTLKENEEKIILTGDFGGGTSDFTIIKIRGGEKNNGESRKKDALSMTGTKVGGDTFDSILMWEKIAKYFGKEAKYKSISGYSLGVPIAILRTLCQWHLIPNLRNERIYSDLEQIMFTVDDKKAIQNLIDIIRGNYGLMLFGAIEEAKCELSLQDASQIVYNNGLQIKENISRAEFEEMINSELEKIKKCVALVLTDAGLRDSEIDMVFLTGGSSNIPCIKNIFINKFGAEKIKETDAFTSVAYGLGLSGYLF